MKLHFAILFSLFILSTSLSAQTSEEISATTMDLSALSPGEYEVSSKKSLIINGSEFVELKLTKKGSEQDNCHPGLNKAIVFANLGATIMAGYGVTKVNPTQDKIKHALAGYVVGNLTTGTMQLILPQKMKHRKLISMLSGIGASVIVGVGKEYWDSKGHGNVDSKDALVTALGGVAGSITISFADVSKMFNGKKKR